ncbi:MAG: hypothetical protein H8E21_14405, partial [Gammaproteobacteria bacterium]|nr:hypothetical protein [Gammaproteobacteria bacterium]
MRYKKYLLGSLFASLTFTPLVQADSTLVYELNSKDGARIQHTIAISGRWLRLDTDPARQARYTVMDMGRMLMFEIDDQAKNFQITRMGRLYWPSNALTAPVFKPLAKKEAVSGIRCQPVQEMTSATESIANHCMTAGAMLGLNAREMITLSRLFMSARRLGLSWPGVATADERQVSINSQHVSGTTQQFKSVTHQRIDNTRFKVPAGYQRILPDLPVAAAEINK